MEDTGGNGYEKVELPLLQNVGAAAQPVVTPGARVEKGDLIAEIPEGKLGANLHASISGTVTAVSAQSIMIQKYCDT